MISFRDATARLTELGLSRAGSHRARVESVPLAETPGRVLASRVTSEAAIPPFDNSAMDGFAVRSGETAPERIVGSAICAGDAPIDGTSAPALHAFEIMTGAPVPRGFDAVIRVEDTQSESAPDGTRRIRLGRLPAPGENIRRAGEDFRPGEPVAVPGTWLGPEHILALASLGIARVPCVARPRVAVIATGSELVPVEEGRALAPGQIYNSTAPYLVAALRAAGASPSFHGIVKDDAGSFVALVRRLMGDPPDVIVTTGAVSMGSHDFVAEALGALGARTVFHKVAIRPGKPVLFAELTPGPAFFGLPGNPVSTAVGLRFFVEPYLRALTGRPAERPAVMALAEGVAKPAALRCFFKAHRDLGRGEARVLKGQPSFMVSPLLATNAWAVLPEGIPSLEAGAPIETFPLFAAPYEGERSP